MKCRVGLSNDDKVIICDKSEAIIEIATMELKNAQPQKKYNINNLLHMMRKSKGTKLKMQIYLMKLRVLTLLTL